MTGSWFEAYWIILDRQRELRKAAESWRLASAARKRDGKNGVKAPAADPAGNGKGQRLTELARPEGA